MAKPKQQMNSKPLARKYHVYDNRIEDVAGKPIVEVDGVRTVELTAKEAQYLIDQGAIGVTPQNDLSDDAFYTLKQMRRDPPEA